MTILNSIKVKLIAIINGLSILSIMLSGIFFVYNLQMENKRQIEMYRQTLEEDINYQLRTQVEGVVSMLEQIYKEQQVGKLTEVQAKLQAANYVRDMRYNNEGYFWIDTVEGVNVVLLGREAEGKSRINAIDPNGNYYIKEMIENGMNSGGGFTDLMFAKPGETEPLPKRNYTLLFKPYNWVIGTGVWIDYIDNKVAQQQKIADDTFQSQLIQVIVCMILVQLIITALAWRIGKKFTAPIISATQNLGEFAKGNFTLIKQDNFSISNDEIGIMQSSIITLNQNMNKLVSDIMEASNQIAAAAEELSASTDQSATLSNHMADSITQVAGSCNTQFVSVKNAQAKVETVSENMKGISTNVVSANEQIQAATDAAFKGSKDVTDAVSQMSLIDNAVNNAAVVVAKLGERSKEIGTIVDTIAGIAGQTNLLALNAAIEAARAGEHGKGFAVVAEEVRKLAEQSQDAAKQIATLISEIQYDTQEAVVTMNEGTSQVKIGTEVVNNAGGSFQQISVVVKGITDQSAEMERILGTMATDVTEIVNTVQHIEQLSQNVAAESQNVSAATEEQAASSTEMAQASQSVAQLAQELRMAIQKFTI